MHVHLLLDMNEISIKEWTAAGQESTHRTINRSSTDLT
jgi:hypothetical protein